MSIYSNIQVNNIKITSLFSQLAESTKGETQHR